MGKSENWGPYLSGNFFIPRALCLSSDVSVDSIPCKADQFFEDLVPGYHSVDLGPGYHSAERVLVG